MWILTQLFLFSLLGVHRGAPYLRTTVYFALPSKLSSLPAQTFSQTSSLCLMCLWKWSQKLSLRHYSAWIASLGWPKQRRRVDLGEITRTVPQGREEWVWTLRFVEWRGKVKDGSWKWKEERRLWRRGGGADTLFLVLLVSWRASRIICHSDSGFWSWVADGLVAWSIGWEMGRSHII